MPVGSAGGSSGDRIVKATVAELNNSSDSVGFPYFKEERGAVG